MKFLKALILAVGRVIHRIAPRFSKKLEWAYPFERQKTTRLATPRTKSPRMAMLSSAGLYLENQKPFQYKNFYGDFSFRVFPSEFPISSLRLTESDFDRKGFEADPASLFPLPELKNAISEFGGQVALHHFSLLGFNLRRKELLMETVPAILKILKEDKTNLVFLIPACVVCHEVLPQVASTLEEGGIATVTFAFIARALESARGPRTILFGGGCGLPFGDSANERRKDLLRMGMRAAFEMKAAGEVWRYSPPVPAGTKAGDAATVR